MRKQLVLRVGAPKSWRFLGYKVPLGEIGETLVLVRAQNNPGLVRMTLGELVDIVSPEFNHKDRKLPTQIGMGIKNQIGQQKFINET